MSCRRRARLRQVVGHSSCSSSATPASLLEHGALRTLATRKLYQQTLEHFLTLVAERKLTILGDTYVGTAPQTYSNAQYMFGVQQHRGSTLTAALMHRYPRYSRHGEDSAGVCEAGNCSLQVRTRKAFPQYVWLSLAATTGLGGLTAHGRVISGHAVQ